MHVFTVCIILHAAAILERRKRTALYLRQATEQVANLEEPQVEELKQQIKVSGRVCVGFAGAVCLPTATC